MSGGNWGPNREVVRKGGFGVAVAIGRSRRRTCGNEAKIRDRRTYRPAVEAKMALFFTVNGVGLRLVHPTAHNQRNMSEVDILLPQRGAIPHHEGIFVVKKTGRGSSSPRSS
jgi:hypothetical protein